MAHKITVFYAWQSHRPKSLCYRLIKDAAETALTCLKAEHQVETESAVEEAPDINFELDYSTAGVPGSPPVAETILSKIKACDIFLADLTIVTTYKTEDDRRHAAPNANVLIEYGYARHAKGTERIVGVQNTFFGVGDDLPFDLRHVRHPISFQAELGDATKRAKAQHGLADTLLDAFRTIVKEVIERDQHTLMDTAVVASAAERNRIRDKFEAEVVANRFRSVLPGPAIAVSILPLIPLQPKLDLGPIENSNDLHPMSRGDLGIEPYERSFVSHARQSQDNGGFTQPHAATELDERGVILAAMRYAVAFGRGAYPLRGAEQILIENISKYLFSLRVWGVVGPVEVCVVLTGTGGQMLYPSERARQSPERRLTQDPFKLDTVTIPGSVKGGPTEIGAVAKLMRQAFTVVWRGGGFRDDPNFDGRGEWTPDRA